MKCFLHNDMDGRCSGALVRLLYERSQELKSEDYIECNYTTVPIDNVQDGEKCFFVDYSFTKDTCDVLFKLLKKKCDITWIDHHKSSLELINEYPVLKNIKGIRDKRYSGAALTYMFFTGKPFTEIPNFVKYVSDYDTWTFDLKDSLFFFYGLQTQEYGALSDIWDILLKEYKGKENTVLNSIIKEGEIIDKYVTFTNRELFRDIAFQSKFEDVPCWVINQNKGSLVFGDNFKDYPLAITFVFNGKEYVYSLYSNNKDIDCSKIAEKYGGGGHKGAAGFRSKKLLLKMVDA